MAQKGGGGISGATKNKGGDEGAPDGIRDAGRPKGRSSGESQGGAYPNPHRGKKPRGGFMGHGGQTEIDYHGTGQLGKDPVEGQDNVNSPAKNE